jgi:hypothetical protein
MSNKADERSVFSSLGFGHFLPNQPRRKRHAEHQKASPQTSISTPCGDFQPKKCALEFDPCGNSMENAPPLSSRVHLFIIEFHITSSVQSPPMTFHIENVFGSPFLANNDFCKAHLTPMITSQNSPENQISRRCRSTAVRSQAEQGPSFWSWMLGPWIAPESQKCLPKTAEVVLPQPAQSVQSAPSAPVCSHPHCRQRRPATKPSLATLNPSKITSYKPRCSPIRHYPTSYILEASNRRKSRIFRQKRG